jgi:excisionase family DNA binding protein
VIGPLDEGVQLMEIPAVSPRARGALLDVRECAAYLGTSERHVRRLVTDKRIPFLKLGPGKLARLRFDTAELEAWLAEHSYESEDR